MTNQESKALTREAIKISLVQLMQTQSFDEITVSSILKRAGVSRAGFYRNYPSKESVLQEVVENFYTHISTHFLDIVKSKHDTERYVILFRSLKEQPDMVQMFLAGEQKNSYLKISNTYVEEHYSHLPMEQQYCVIALWRGVREITIRWLENGMVEPPEVMGALITRLFNFDAVPLD